MMFIASKTERNYFSLAELETAIGFTVSPYQCFQGKCFIKNDYKNKTVSCTPEMFAKIMQKNVPDANGFIDGIKFVEVDK